MSHPLSAHSIRYAGIMHGVSDHPASAVAGQLILRLAPLWDLSYREMTRRAPEIVEVRRGSLVYRLDDPGQSDEREEERVVVVFGFAMPPGEDPDTPGMQGFTRAEASDRARRRIEAMHVASRARGALMDINLFPQRSEMTREPQGGWSDRGVAFRQMEAWCAEHPGTFFFARPIYLDGGATPHALEYGVLRSPRDLWVERFPN